MAIDMRTVRCWVCGQEFYRVQLIDEEDEPCRGCQTSTALLDPIGCSSLSELAIKWCKQTQVHEPFFTWARKQWTTAKWEARHEQERIETFRRRGTRESWSKIRRRIWERDKGICQVCGDDLNETPRHYECGHIIDRVAGGTDLDDNLVVMCVICNRLKPIHRTREQYERWRATGGPMASVLYAALPTLPA